MARRSPVCYAYAEKTPEGNVRLGILPNCKSLASLLRQTPEGATPGYYDDRDGMFRPLAGRAA
jgi:hypothetical protein